MRGRSRFSDRIFRLLIRIYPREFRVAYEDDLLQALRDRRGEPRFQRRLLGPMRLWWFVLSDLANSLPDLRRLAIERRRLSAALGSEKASTWSGLESLMQDLRYGIRTLRRNPGFAAASVIILALGIGANTTMFTLAHSLFLRPPPLVLAPGELTLLTRIYEDGVASPSMSYPDYEFFRDNNDAFSGVLAYSSGASAVAIGYGDDFTQARAGVVSGNYFDVLGVQMSQGRSFLPEEDQAPGEHAVVILGNGFWKRHFGSDPQAVGSTLSVNGNPYTVVGVAPEGFNGVSPVEEPPDLFVPLMMQGVLAPGAERDLRRIDGEISYYLKTIGRLLPEVELAAAQANMDVLKARWNNEFASWIEATGPTPHRIVLTSRYQFSPRAGDSLGRLMTLLFLVVGTVLLIASANVGILLLARASVRQREMGIRSAIGAGRIRLVRQLLTESLLLALAGGVSGILIAFWGASIAATLVPYSFSIEFKPDLSVALFTGTLSACAIVLFGLAPAWQLSRSDISSVLHHISLRHRTFVLRNALVIGQLTLSIVLLTGAGLFVRSLMNARAVQLGFEPDQKLLTTVNLNDAAYDEEEGRQFVRAMIDRLAAVPGVSKASTTRMVPFRGSWGSVINVPGTEYADVGFDAGFNRVGPGYFELMGNPIVAGRGFDRSDDRNAPLAVVVNEALAERIWPGETAVGKTILRRDSEWTVIGVASNATYYEVGEAPQTQVYVAQLQDYSPLLSFVIATAGPPSDISSAVNEAIREYDPALPVQRIATLRDIVKNEIGQYRVTAILVALFGGLALLLAAVGLYGVQSYLVSRRTREIGIRMALGAAEGQLARSVIGRSAAMTMVGIVIGVGVALVAARLIESMLFNVNARDPVTFVTAPLVLLAVAVLASVLPAYRASRVDPVEALRQE